MSSPSVSAPTVDALFHTVIDKIRTSAAEALSDVPDGATVMIGGFGTAGLPNELVDALQPIAAEYGWAIEVIDVDQHPELEARWDELVPVLLHGEHELCHYHLDEAAVRAYCSGFPLESRA